jgi:hypothetical protein
MRLSMNLTSIFKPKPLPGSDAELAQKLRDKLAEAADLALELEQRKFIVTIEYFEDSWFSHSWKSFRKNRGVKITRSSYSAEEL